MISGRDYPDFMREEVFEPLGKLGSRENNFKGLFMGRIDTPDATRTPHVVFVECRIRDGRLTGFAAAIAMNQYFCHPYRMELDRIVREDKD